MHFPNAQGHSCWSFELWSQMELSENSVSIAKYVGELMRCYGLNRVP